MASRSGSSTIGCAGARRGLGGVPLGGGGWLLDGVTDAGDAARACPLASTVNQATRPPLVSSTPRASTGRPAWRATAARCWNTDE